MRVTIERHADWSKFRTRLLRDPLQKLNYRGPIEAVASLERGSETLNNGARVCAIDVVEGRQMRNKSLGRLCDNSFKNSCETLGRRLLPISSWCPVLQIGRDFVCGQSLQVILIPRTRRTSPSRPIGQEVRVFRLS